MRIKTVFFVASLYVFGATPALAQNGHDLFQQALVQEQAEGNLRSAIVLYTRVVTEFPLDRPLVARALVQIGRAHETLGSTEAQRAYQRIVSDYPDQREQVVVARTRLAALTQPATVVEASGVVVRQVWTRAALAVSPDGRYLVFKDKEDLAVHDLQTGESRRLPRGTGRIPDYPAIAMSPDGRQLAYLSWNSDDAELRLRDLTGSRPRVLVSNPEVPWLEPFAWSPDGKQILTVFERKDGTNQIVLVSAADGSVRVLKSLEWRYPQQMSFSPDGRYIAYDSPTRRDSPERDIFVLATDGSRESLLVEHPANDFFPLWTPDGKSILFASDRSRTWDQWLIPVAQGTAQGSPTLIKQNVGRITPLGFTADGNYYYNLNHGFLDVYIAALDSATGQPLGEPALASDRFRGGNTLPEWSPDGQYLAYLSRRGAPESGVRSSIIAIRSLETGQERELTPQLAFLEDTRLRWSPDGRSFLVAGEDNDGHRGLYQINAQTGDVTPIVVTSRERQPESGANRWHAEWSLDGKAIFYVYDEDGNSCEIRIRDMETGEERLLYRPALPSRHLGNLALSPDGRRLAFGSAGGAGPRAHFGAEVVLVMPASGGAPREVLKLEQETVGSVTYSFSWTRDGSHLLFSKRVAAPTIPSELWRVPAEGGEPQRIGLATWGRGGVRAHPDGRRIAFTNQTDRKNELWMIENFLPQPSVAR